MQYINATKLSQAQNQQIPFFSPESHAFNAGIATATKSINAAVIFSHLFFWLKHNKIHGTNQIEERTWMYQSIPQMALHFPYFTEKQVKDALIILDNYGYILKGNFHEDKMERTNWYALKYEHWLDVSQKKSPTVPKSPMQESKNVYDKTLKSDAKGLKVRCSNKDKDNEIEDNKEREREGAAPPARSFSSKKEKKEGPKIERAEHVHISDEDHAKLIKEYGHEKVLVFYTILSDWKNDTPKSKWKKDDYRSILRWVVVAASEVKNKHLKNNLCEENQKLCKKIERKFDRKDMIVGPDYIEFINGPTCSHIKFDDKDFTQKVSIEMKKRKINVFEI